MKSHRPFRLSPSLYLLLSFLALASTATLPAIPLSVTQDNESPNPLNATDYTVSAAGRQVHCAATIPLSPFYLTMHDCAAAIREIGDSDESGRFHTGEPFDEWSVPITRKGKWCKVTVQMDQGYYEDTASWLQVNLAATQLNLQCASRYRLRYAGGWATVGTTNRIKVRIDWHSTQVTGVNATIPGTGMVSDS